MNIIFAMVFAFLANGEYDFAVEPVHDTAECVAEAKVIIDDFLKTDKKYIAFRVKCDVTERPTKDEKPLHIPLPGEV